MESSTNLAKAGILINLLLEVLKDCRVDHALGRHDGLLLSASLQID